MQCLPCCRGAASSATINSMSQKKGAELPVPQVTRPSAAGREQGLLHEQECCCTSEIHKYTPVWGICCFCHHGHGGWFWRRPGLIWRRSCQQPIKAQAGKEWEAEYVGVNVSLSPAVAVPLPRPSSASFNHLRPMQKLCIHQVQDA